MGESQTATRCPRHPKVETSLRCATCGTLICPRCLVQTPVGMKCRACGTQKGKVFTLSPLNVLCGSATGVVLGIVAGLGVDLMGWFSILLAVAYGTFAGGMILRAAGRKRGIRMEILTGAAIALGAIGGRLVLGATVITPSLGISHAIAGLFLPSPFPIIALVIAIATAVGRIRYI